jgi:CDP-archaeol synthase
MARLWTIIRLLFLLTLANGAPVLAKKLLGARFSLPVDSGTMAPDHRALFGSSKTLRGVLLSVIFTAVGGRVLGLPFGTAALIGSSAMAGDLFSSFCKRRLRLPTSSRALGLDQVPESLFPLLLCRRALSLNVLDILLIVAGFFLGELAISRVLYRFHLRDQPY